MSLILTGLIGAFSFAGFIQLRRNEDGGGAQEKRRLALGDVRQHNSSTQTSSIGAPRYVKRRGTGRLLRSVAGQHER